MNGTQTKVTYIQDSVSKLQVGDWVDYDGKLCIIVDDTDSCDYDLFCIDNNTWYTDVGYGQIENRYADIQIAVGGATLSF